MKNINKAITFAKKETVLIVAMLLAVISAFLVTPDKAYASYIDFRTLDRKSTRLNSSHSRKSRMPSSA